MALRGSLVNALTSARTAVDGGQSASQREWLPDKTWESLSCRTVTDDSTDIVVEITVDTTVAELLSVPLPASRVARVRHRSATSASSDPGATPLLVRVPFAGTVDAVVEAVWSSMLRLRQEAMLPIVPNPHSCYARGASSVDEAAGLLQGDLHAYVTNASGAPDSVPIRRYKAGAGGAAASVLSLDSARLHGGMKPPPASGVPFKQRLAKLGQRGLPPVRLHVCIPQGILELRRFVAAEAEARMRLQGAYLLHACGVQLQQEQWRAYARSRACIIALQAQERHTVHKDFDRCRFDAEARVAQREERVARQDIVNEFFTTALPRACAAREQLEFAAVTSAVLRSIEADEQESWAKTMRRFERRRSTIVQKHNDAAAFAELSQRTTKAFNEHQRRASLLFARAVESLSGSACVL